MLTCHLHTIRRSHCRSNCICCCRFRSHINRRSVAITFTPRISDIARPSILVDVQRNMLTFTNSGLGCSDLNICTESINRERVRNGLTTIRAGNGYSINTGRNLKCIRCNFSSGIRAPCIFGSIYCISCQQCAVTFADNIVTRDGKQSRSSLNRNRISLGGTCRNAIMRINSLNTIGMDTHRRRNTQNRLIFTRNFNAILIPNVSGMSWRSGGDHRLGTFANRLRKSSN